MQPEIETLQGDVTTLNGLVDGLTSSESYQDAVITLNASGIVVRELP
jgi:hypothetical protein